MIEDLIHGPRSSAERAEKLGQFGPGMAPPVRFALFFSKLKAQQRKAETNLLEGVNVYFTGYTEKLNVHQLKNLLHKHGAQTSYAFTAAHTTHIVCENLCASKMERFTRCTKKRVHVVHPDWIIDSVQAQKIQPESKYEILPTGKTASILDYVEREGKLKVLSKPKPHESASQNKENLDQAFQTNSSSISISSQEGDSKKKEYKRVSHPLMRQRRSGQKHKTASCTNEASIETSSNLRERVGVSIMRSSLKQQRLGSILKRSNIASAQKEFKRG